MDLTKLSVVELKALGYDQGMILEQTRQNLLLINQELSKRQGSEIKAKEQKEVDTEGGV